MYQSRSLPSLSDQAHSSVHEHWRDQVQAVVLEIVHNDLLYEPGKYVPFADVEHLDVGVMFPRNLAEVVQVDGYDFT